MAKLIKADTPDNNEQLGEIFLKTFQSAHLNFLFGSGASSPAIPVLGPIEIEIQDLFDQGKEKEAQKKLYEFIQRVSAPTNKLIAEKVDGDLQTVRNNYKEFLLVLNRILSRQSNILSSQVNVFTTNYDLFFEDALSGSSPILLNDGFDRRARLDNKAIFSPEKFFDITSHTGTLYSYKYEIPTLNLIKLHGSLSWRNEGDEVSYCVEAVAPIAPQNLDKPEQVKAYVQKFALIYPYKAKFRSTVLDRIYYDLFRMFSNELDKASVALFAFGFSFDDEHIYDITLRALKNPALHLFIFAFDQVSQEKFLVKFEKNNNVTVITLPEGDVLDFPKFNKLLSLPFSLKGAD